MSSLIRPWLAIGIVFISVTSGRAENKAPELTTIFPLGCQQGSSIEIMLTGKNLEDAKSLVFAHSGILSESVGKNRWRITVAAEVPATDWDVWLVTAAGLSNPRCFAVTKFPVVTETEKNDTLETAQEVRLPAVVDAKLDRAADIDWFRFEGKAGQQVTISCRSLTLDATAQPVLTVTSPDGRELMHSEGHRREPVLNLTMTQTGTYAVQVFDRAYRTGDHSLYRLTLATGPRLLYAFPNLLEKGKESIVTLYGYELHGAEPLPAQPSGLQQLRMKVVAPHAADADNGGWTTSHGAILEGFRYDLPEVSGSVRLGLAETDVVVEEEDNNRIESLQRVSIPCQINGRFLTKGDIDWYGFSAEKGQSLQIEAFGERFGRLMDLDIAIHDANGKRLTTLKDVVQPKGLPGKFTLSSTDPSGAWKAPADGEYRLVIRDLYGGSVCGFDRTYELHIRRLRPSFQVFAIHHDDDAPRGLTVPRGGTAVVQLVALRRDGFNGSIQIDAGELPPGIVRSQCWIGPGQSTTLCAVTSSPNAQMGSIDLSLVGTSNINSQNVTSSVRAMALVRRDTPTLTRLIRGNAICIGPAAPFRLSIEPESTYVPAGSLLRVTVELQKLKNRPVGAVDLTWHSLPSGMKAAVAKLPEGQGKLIADLNVPPKLQPGWYTIGLHARGKYTRDKGDAEKTETKAKSTDFAVWAQTFSFEAVASFATALPKVKELKLSPGEMVELPFEIKREKGAPDDLIVGLSLPPGEVSLIAEPVKLTKDENTGKLTVSAATDAKPGPVASVAIVITTRGSNRETRSLTPIKVVVQPMKASKD